MVPDDRIAIGRLHDDTLVFACYNECGTLQHVSTEFATDVELELHCSAEPDTGQISWCVEVFDLRSPKRRRMTAYTVRAGRGGAMVRQLQRLVLAHIRKPSHE